MHLLAWRGIRLGGCGGAPFSELEPSHAVRLIGVRGRRVGERDDVAEHLLEWLLVALRARHGRGRELLQLANQTPNRWSPGPVHEQEPFDNSRALRADEPRSA